MSKYAAFIDELVRIMLAITYSLCDYLIQKICFLLGY